MLFFIKTKQAFIVICCLFVFTLLSCSNSNQAEGLNRNPAHVAYSKHARCRMQCRHIYENEVVEILHEGAINYSKSQLNTDACHNRYAVEGYSKDNQHLRIIFASCGNDITVITCIDLDNDWWCDCQ